ncbi:hypothetical protein WMF27_18315 [Sorangium sp. So ce281]|uniref:hypothetical protein n=1 Tax=unclassified Sorangium TaxID=2621164 RepID=UPI003F5E5455
MSGDLRSPIQASFAPRFRDARRARTGSAAARPRRGAALLAGALLAVIAPACRGSDAGEDAPATASTGIPLAAPGALGAPLDAPPAGPSVPSSPFADPEGLQVPPDPADPPEMPLYRAPPGNTGGSGVEL